jgi:hypothetical protein
VPTILLTMQRRQMPVAVSNFFVGLELAGDRARLWAMLKVPRMPCVNVAVRKERRWRRRQSPMGLVDMVGFAGLLALLLGCCAGAGAQHRRTRASPLDETAIARAVFGNDAPWYVANIPFLDIDDAAIQRTYFYRWQLYRSHLRQIGAQGTDETEFLGSVPWARHPFEDLNDSSSFHILEGRWLRNPVYVQSLVDHLYSGAGDDRHFSESVAAATLAWTQVTGNPAPALRQLAAMEYVFNAWDDHFDRRRNLYWIEPLLDATEYTISSIDASGAGFNVARPTDSSGFTGGFAFRPSINAYQYGNALAIAAFAGMAGQPEVQADYTARAQALRTATLQQLWNPALQHFTDIYQRSTSTVKAGDFVRGRELVGMVPWQFELPPMHAPGSSRYAAGWQHVLSAQQLGGQAGVRTVEPSYAKYRVQYRYDATTGKPECQWNGPSWPFQTSQMLSGLANLLQDYDHAGVSASDYVHLLRQYTLQHRLASGTLDLQEDYNPDTGGPIVGLPRSHHYNHSTYIDLVLSGLIGIRPRSDDVLEVAPLLPEQGGAEPPIRYFALQGLRYHGHDVTITFDRDGSRYHQGRGLSVFVDGQRRAQAASGRVLVRLARVIPQAVKPRIDLAANPEGAAPSAWEGVTPIAQASSSASDAAAPDTALYEPLDGRLWFFPEIAHGWSPQVDAVAAAASLPREDWYAVDLRTPHRVGSVEMAFFSAAGVADVPATVRVQVRAGDGWRDVGDARGVKALANGITRVVFPTANVTRLRLLMTMPPKSLPERLIQLEVFAP